MKLFVLIQLVLSSYSFSQTLQPDENKIVLEFIEAIKSMSPEKSLRFISFPIQREYPLPDIKNQAEFIYRYHELFDDSISQIIINSNVDTDWKKVGWRGIMLNQGDLWLDPNSGKVIGINFQSKQEREKRNEIIRVDKALIHPSLNNYTNPILVIETMKFHIRIDELDDSSYRYAAWPLNVTEDQKPDLIGENGTLEFMGSGGNHTYTFQNGEYTYSCRINRITAEGTPPAQLIVLKNGVEIVNQAAEVKRN